MKDDVINDMKSLDKMQDAISSCSSCQQQLIDKVHDES